MLKNILKKFAASLIGLVFSFLVLELLLRIFHPFSFSVKGDHIVLPINKTEKISNTEISKLEPVIHHSTNSIGFRGPEKPNDFKNHLTIFAVGGSTTECRFLSDGKDWPSLLGKKLNVEFKDAWINNAGFDGHSTFGHLKLLHDYLTDYQPKVILFLVGRNDVLRDDLEWGSKADEVLSKKALNFVSKSEAFSLFINLYRVLKARNRNLRHFNLNLETAEKLDVPENKIQEQLNFHQEVFITGYKNRLQQIIDTCRKHRIEPVFITQPALLGQAIDSLTNVDLATIKTGAQENGRMLWKLLQLYNQETISSCNLNNCFVIDLGNEMPKNSLYFYDYVHFTNEGSALVADILQKHLSGWMKEKYPAHVK